MGNGKEEKGLLDLSRVTAHDDRLDGEDGVVMGGHGPRGNAGRSRCVHNGCLVGKEPLVAGVTGDVELVALPDAQAYEAPAGPRHLLVEVQPVYRFPLTGCRVPRKRLVIGFFATVSCSMAWMF